MTVWNWIFRTGLAIALLGFVWTIWPAPGERAYGNYRRGHPLYHHGPRVSIDLGHFNDAPADARFLALADLLVWDGYRVTRSKQYLVPEYLKDTDVLVIGNALPYPAGLRRLAGMVGLDAHATFASEEVDAVREWVRGGGSLLLEAGVPGSGRAAAPLAAALGLRFHDCLEPVFVAEPETEKHTILDGRSDYDEQVLRAAVLANGWIEAASPDAPLVALLKAPAARIDSCAAGKPIAVAAEFGRGRVVAFTAQMERDEDLLSRLDIDPRQSNDNVHFVLNAMHWLSR